MDGAMNRIEAALARIEAAARKPSHNPENGPIRDEALRDRVCAALADLDKLIAGLER